jgi:hypothetical protein
MGEVRCRSGAFGKTLQSEGEDRVLIRFETIHAFPLPRLRDGRYRLGGGGRGLKQRGRISTRWDDGSQVLGAKVPGARDRWAGWATLVHVKEARFGWDKVPVVGHLVHRIKPGRTSSRLLASLAGLRPIFSSLLRLLLTLHFVHVD